MTPSTAAANTPAPERPGESDPEPLLAGYELGAAFDEMIGRDREPRPHYRPLSRQLRQTTAEEFRRRKAMTDLSMRQDGVGFTVYRAEEGFAGSRPC